MEVGKDSIWENGMELSYWYLDTFVSGRQNENGMQMKSFFQDSKVVTRYTFDKQFQGGPGLVHGGILSAAIDDLMGYASTIHKRACVTAKLEVNYILPVQIEKEFIIEAWISEIDGKKIYAESIIYDGEIIHTEASALFIDLGERASEVWNKAQNRENQIYEYKEETQYP